MKGREENPTTTIYISDRMLLLFLLLVFHSCYSLSDLTNEQCTKDSCSSLTPTTSYLLYDVNSGEGFNLRRDVYVRMANLVRTLRERTPPTMNNWSLVLPPWGPLYHWFSDNLQRDQLAWSLFFDLTSLSRFVPVVEFEEFLRLSSSTAEATISHVYTLQNFLEGWGEHFEEKLEIRPCNDKATYRKQSDNYYHGWFFGYEDRVRAEQFHCLSAQGFVTLLADYILKNITGTTDANEAQSVHSVMFDRAETLMHADYGGQSYWRARRSMRYAKQLIHLGEHCLRRSHAARRRLLYR